MKYINIHLNDVFRKNKPSAIVRLTGVKEFRCRLWVAARLIKLAAWISKGVVVVEVANE